MVGVEATEGLVSAGSLTLRAATQQSDQQLCACIHIKENVQLPPMADTEPLGGVSYN